jgi:gluconolactonase
MEPEIPIERFEVFASGLDHPECVAFDCDGNLWAGGEAGQIYRIDSARKVETIAQLGGFTGGLAFSPEDELFVCNPSLGMVRVRRDGKHEVFATHADSAKLPADGSRKLICPNFPVFDRRGNLYVSDSGEWKKQNGCLVRFTPDGHGTVIGGPYGYANGLALSADGKSLFMVESDSDRVYRFELRDDGSLDTKEVYAEKVGRLPDGLALDTGGNLYASCYASDDIHRINPAREKTLLAWDRWAILLSRPTNMAFRDGWMYVANLGRTMITRVHLNVTGVKLANQP